MLTLTSKKDIVDQVDLEEIEELFRTLLTMQDSNLETYYAAAIFEMNEMENNKEAKSLIYLGIEKAEEKIKELKELLVEIESK